MSISSIDQNDIESIFTVEKMAKALGNGPLGISSINYNPTEIELYPNPAKGKINIYTVSNTGSKSGMLKLTGLDGREIMSKPFNVSSSGEVKLELNTESIPAGIYFCSLAFDKGFVAVRKFVKE